MDSLGYLPLGLYVLAFIFMLVESLWLSARQSSPVGVKNAMANSLARLAQLGAGLSAAMAFAAVAVPEPAFLIAALLFAVPALHWIMVAQTVLVATITSVDDTGVHLRVGRRDRQVTLDWRRVSLVGYGGAHNPLLPKLWNTGLVEALLITDRRLGPYAECYVLVESPDSPQLLELLARANVGDMPATYASTTALFGLIPPVLWFIRPDTARA